MNFILSWVKDKAILIVFGLALFVGGAWIGYDYRDTKADKQELTQVVQNKDSQIAQIKDSTEKANEEDQKQQAVQQEVKVVYKTIYRDVIKYRDTPQAKVEIDGEWVKRHDKAACGPDASCQTPEQAERTDVTTTAGEALETVTVNYEPYFLCLRKLKGLEDFYNNRRLEINGTEGELK